MMQQWLATGQNWIWNCLAHGMWEFSLCDTLAQELPEWGMGTSKGVLCYGGQQQEFEFHFFIFLCCPTKRKMHLIFYCLVQQEEQFYRSCSVLNKVSSLCTLHLTPLLPPTPQVLSVNILLRHTVEAVAKEWRLKLNLTECQIEIECRIWNTSNKLFTCSTCTAHITGVIS